MHWLKITALSSCLLLGGCAARKLPSDRVSTRVVLDRPCIRSIDLTPETYCDRPLDGKFDCHGATVTYVRGCEVVKVDPKSKEKK